MIDFIEINNFRCFDEVRVEGFQRINLITGLNNVGKTALLEAIHLSVHSRHIVPFLNALKHQLRVRKASESLNETDFIEIQSSGSGGVNLKIESGEKRVSTDQNLMNRYSIDFSITSTGFTFPYEQKYSIIDNELIYEFSINDPSSGLNFEFTDNYREDTGYGLLSFSEFVDRNLINTTGFPEYLLIQPSVLSGSEITILYGFAIENGKERFIVDALKVFEPLLEDIKIIPSREKGAYDIKAKLIGQNKFVKFYNLGEGMRRFITVLAAIWSSKDGYLFIDEIENGIHYTRYEHMWKLILESSREANCQVFATTHSLECIQAYNTVISGLDTDDGVLMELYRQKHTGNFTAKVYDRDLLRYSIEYDHEVRGE